MLRKILATIAVTAALIAGALAPAGPAQAAYSDCNNGHVCLFMGIGGSGNLYQWTGVYLYDRGGLTLAGEINNGSTSWRNRSNVPMRMFDQSNCAGPYFVLQPGNQLTAGAAWNNRVSSMEPHGDSQPGNCNA